MDNYQKALGFLNGNIDINDDIIDILVECDDLYTNSANSYLCDFEYDNLRLIAQKYDPTNPYFLGVGAATRVDKIKLPYPMGSLDQVQIGELQDWVKSKKLVNERFVVSDKMDGISALLVYDENGWLQIALTRGDGIEGQDITRHVKCMPESQVPPKVSGKMAVRCEIEFSDINFEKIKTVCLRKSGEEFKNARNAIAGLMNNKTVNEFACQHASVFAYEIMGSIDDKTVQLDKLENEGFNVVNYGEFRSSVGITDNVMADEIDQRKFISDYAIDGIVIEVNSYDTRQRLTLEKKSDNNNPAYAIKYKILDSDNIAEAIVESVEWNLSKHGYAKPKVKLQPFVLQDVTISNTTGFNAKYILDNKIGKGTVVRMTRSGDVIPYILNVVKSTTAEMPENLDDYEWSETKTDLILKNKNNSEVKLKQLESWATAMDIPLLKVGNIKQLIQHGYDTPAKIVNINKDDLISIVGKNGNKIYDGMVNVLNPIPLEKLFGAYPSFGTGLGIRKFKKFIEYARSIDKFDLNSIFETDFADEISKIEGWNTKTFEIFIKGLGEFSQYINDIKNKLTIEIPNTTQQSGILSNKKICFTGFRDKQLEEKVISLGGEITDGITKNTNILVALDTNTKSSKIDKATKNNIQIFSKLDFEEFINNEKSEIKQENSFFDYVS
jgi:NAD-dependent DNA ligase